VSETAERLYERALRVPAESRAAFLAAACPDDARLRDEVLSLLDHAEAAEGFFAKLMDSRIGRIVRHYRILSHIGSGGMGTVYRARDTRLGRDVALKFLPPHLSAEREATERLLAEARAAAALQHPNVCVVHDVGETDDGRPFIAMALCEGETLREKLRRGPFTVDAAVATAAQIARGLAAAHARGVVHRDVKPANVMLADDGTLKLLDFGLATLGDSRTIEPAANAGTIGYMSPEQLRGDVVDHRTDLWSLGVVLYEMLAGVRPFRGQSAGALARSILDDDPSPLAAHAPAVPPLLTAIIDRLLRKDVSTRTESMGALLTDLASALGQRSGPVPPNEPHRVDALFTYGILDTPPEPAYDELTRLAARLCGAPVAYIKLFDDTRAWFKSKVGLPADLAEIPREASICNSTICQGDLVVIPDCAADEQFRDNPTVAGWPHIRFYCGMPLIDGDGYALGTFCVFDYVPREVGVEHQELIRSLARQVVRHLELRRLSIRLERSIRDLARARHELETEQARSRTLVDRLLPRTGPNAGAAPES
jgi:serine/threonine protein kinase